MSVADDIVAGIVCMKCLCVLVSDDGKLCNCGHPVFCEDCWHELPKRDQDSAPFFHAASGEIGL